MSLKSVFCVVFAVSIVSVPIMAACGGDVDVSHIETPEEALAWAKAAGEAVTGQPVRGVATVEVKTNEIEVDYTSEDSGLYDIRKVIEFKSDGMGNISDVSVTLNEAEKDLLKSHGFSVSVPSGVRIEYRFIDGQGYIGLPASLISQSFLSAPNGISWVTTNTRMGHCVPISIIDHQDSSCDPQTGVRNLISLAESASLGASKKINGVKTVNVSLQVAMSGISRELFGELAQKIPNSDVVNVDVWIDGNGMVRRLVLDETPILRARTQALRGSLTAKDKQVELRTTVDFHDFGGNFSSMEPPPSDRIVGDSSQLP